jgi:hypothetical protein
MTISICTLRFVWGDLVAVFPITVILLCTAEFTTALIVVCLPILRPLLVRKRKVLEAPWPGANDKRIEDALKEYAQWSESSRSGGERRDPMVDDQIREMKVMHKASTEVMLPIMRI